MKSKRAIKPSLFIVSKYYGLDTEPYSAGYIATWAKDIQLVKQAMKEIQHVTQGIIQEIDELMKDRIKELRQIHESSKDQDKNNKNEKDKELQLHNMLQLQIGAPAAEKYKKQPYCYQQLFNKIFFFMLLHVVEG